MTSSLMNPDALERLWSIGLREESMDLNAIGCGNNRSLGGLIICERVGMVWAPLEWIETGGEGCWVARIADDLWWMCTYWLSKPCWLVCVWEGMEQCTPPLGFIASAMSSLAEFLCKGALALCCGMACRMRFSRLLVAPIAGGVWGLVGDENWLWISMQKNCAPYRSCSVVAYSSEGPMKDWAKGYGGCLSKWCQ